jgi:TolA-binding protein
MEVMRKLFVQHTEADRVLLTFLLLVLALTCSAAASAVAVHVAAQVSRSIVEGVELLDRQLRAEEPVETIMTGIKQLQDQLQKLVDQAQPLQ